MERELLSKCIVVRDRMNRQDRDKDLLSSFLSSLLGIGQRPGISFACLEISELSLFDPLIIGTGKLYSNDDNGWLYSLCDAIRQRYIFCLQWSYISTPLPSAHKAFFFLSTNQPIYLHSIRAERPGKKSNRPTNQFKLHPRAITTTTNTFSSHPIPSQPKKKPFLTNIHTHISATPPSNVSLNSSSHLDPFFIRSM